MNTWIRREQRLLIDVLQNCTIAGAEPRQRIREQIVLPVSNRADAVDEDQPPDATSIALGGKHGEPAAPRVAEHIPLRESERLPNRGKVARVVLDASRVGGGRNLRGAAPALIIQNELAPFSERSEGRPQQVVIKEQTAVYANERSRTGYLWREVHGELETACANGAP